MAAIDFVLILLLFGFVLSGFWFGFIHTLGALVGTIAGIFISSRLYDDLAAWAAANFAGALNVWRVVIFIVLFIVISRLIGFLFYLAEKVFNVIAIIPFLKSINRIAGALLGFLEGAIILGALIFIMTKFPFGLADKIFAVSVIKKYLLDAFNILMPFVPQAMKIADEMVK